MATVSNFKKYPPPKKTVYFVEAWEAYLDSVVERKNFRPGHLLQLRTLCDLYQEYGELLDFLAKNGDTYESDGRNGLQIKARPELARKTAVRTEILNQEKKLGVLLEADKAPTKKTKNNDFDMDVRTEDGDDDDDSGDDEDL